MKRLFVIGAVSAALAGTACSDGPTDPAPEAAVLALPELIVSGGFHAPTAGVAAGAGGGLVAYVSLPPGILPEMVRVRIRNLTGGGATSAVPLVEGGFDPVPIPATAGDELELTFTDGEGAASVAHDAVPTRRPPTVVRTNPPRGRTDVALSVVPLGVFSAPIDPGTLASGVRLMRDGIEVAASVALLPDQPWTAELVPASDLEPETTYELQITTDIRDLDGDALEEPVTATFTTGSVPAEAIWATLWNVSNPGPHWVYYWGGGYAVRLTVTRISEPTAVVWDIVGDASGRGVFCGYTVASCTFGSGGAVAHGFVPFGARTVVEAVEPVIPTTESVRYRVSVTLTNGRELSFVLDTYRPPSWWEEQSCGSCSDG